MRSHLAGCLTSRIVMMNSAPIDAGMADRLLAALGEQLKARNERLTLFVVGGSALIALGLVDRTTKDVDVVALVSQTGSSPPTRCLARSSRLATWSPVTSGCPRPG